MPRRIKRAPLQNLQFTWRKIDDSNYLPFLIKENPDAPLVAQDGEIERLHVIKERDEECQNLFEDALQFLEKSFQNAKEAKTKIRDRRLSVAPATEIVPLTPHTNKHKRVRKITHDNPVPSIGYLENDSMEEICSASPKRSSGKGIAKTTDGDISKSKNQSNESSQHVEAEAKHVKPIGKTKSGVKKKPPSSTVRTRRVTRSSKPRGILPNIDEAQMIAEKETSKKEKKKKTVTLKEPCEIADEEMPDDEKLPDVINNSHLTEASCDKAETEQISPPLHAEMEQMPPSSPAQKERTPSSSHADKMESPPQENSNNAGSVAEVRHLIAIHEAFIDKHHVESCETPVKTVVHQMDGQLKSQERGGIRSMAEQVASCVKKKPIVKIVKMIDEAVQNEKMMTPEHPITLNTDDDLAEDKVISNPRCAITATPVGTVSPRKILPARRSLNLCLSFEDSSEEATSDGKMSQDEGDKNVESDSNHEVEDSLDNETDDGESKGQNDDDSAASSSAATILSEDCMETAVVQGRASPQQVRRSSRTKRNIESVPEEGACTPSNKINKQPKIIKPVLLPKIVLHEVARSPVRAVKPSTSVKRAIDQMESGGAMSPARPKKFMKCASPLCQQKSKKKAALTKKSRTTFLNRSTASSRARRTPGHASPSIGSRTRAALFTATTFNPSLPRTNLTPSHHGNLSTEVQSFIKRNTPQKTKTYKEQQSAKEEQLKEKEAREREAQKRKEEEKRKETLERKKKTTEKLQRAAKLRMQREKEESEKKAKMIEQWEKRVADADNVKVLRKKEEEAKGKILRKKQMEAAETVRKEEEERSKKIKEMEQEKEKRLQEQRLQKEHEAAARKQAEQEKLQEKLRLEKVKADQAAEEAREREEQERKKREAEERIKIRKAEEAARLRQQRHEKEEFERKRKVQEEINRRNAEAARMEQERIEKEKEHQRKQKEEAIRRKEKEEAKKRKMEEARAAEELKARKRKEEIINAEELRKKREAMRKEAELRREEERIAEKRRLEEERERKQKEEREKMKKIKEANERLKALQEEQQKQKAVLKNMGQASPGLNGTYNVSSYDMTPHVPKKYAPSTEDDYNIDDITSGDSTDDDERPRKTVPKWAKGGLLRSALINQYYHFSPDKISGIFDFVLNEPMDLGAIFKTFKPRYNKRTSSAMWNSPVKDIGHVSFSDYCRAQN